ncbi:hypothetical protein MP638_006312 [Amoeboaphelidium occidentale]|nr:hypothetical protein MP638_006312 [Amoeboaphelidium occidentale]
MSLQSATSSIVQWRQFSFFEKEPIIAREEEGQSHLAELVKSIELTCTSRGRGTIVLGDASGFIHLVEKSYIVSSFPAYDGPLAHVYQFKQRNYLLTIGQGGSNVESSQSDYTLGSIIKIWDLDKTDKNKSPLCLRSVAVQYGNAPFEVTALSIVEDLNYLALGLSNGVVILMRGDISKDRLTKQRILNEENLNKGGITSLGLSKLDYEAGEACLIVCTEEKTSGYRITPNTETKEFTDMQGCNRNCGKISERDDQFILARPEAVYFYSIEGRGPCVVMDDVKKSMSLFRSYVCIIGGFQSGRAVSLEAKDGLFIYDTRNKIVAFSSLFDGDVKFVEQEWGLLHVFTKTGKVYKLLEKDTSSKLDMLCRKNLFLVAINLARNEKLGENAVSDIYRRFGDHLHQKGDFDGAMQQYMQTIPNLEPSYVILKYLDARRINNLTLYLQELHLKNVATADHTTLLLNCYTKLRDTTKLDEFIKQDTSELYFDVEAAIQVCRSAGFYEHALYLSQKYGQYEKYIEIQLHNLRKYKEALEWLSKMNKFESERLLKKYGRAFVNQIPKETTDLVVDLCVKSIRYYESLAKDALESDSGDLGARTRNNKAIKPETFIPCFVNHPKWLKYFLEQVVEKCPRLESVTVWNTLFELYLSPDAPSLDKLGTDSLSETNQEDFAKALELLRNYDAKYDVNHCLVLCQVNEFRQGLLYLYEKLKMYRDILKFHMDKQEYKQAIAACRKYSEKDSGLWVQLLNYFAERNDCKDELADVLKVIDERNLLSPITVIETLSQSSIATLGMIKPFILRKISQDLSSIEEDKTLITNYQEETDKLEEDLNSLKSEIIVFQSSKCTSCNTPLDLPSVHFLCKHSFHVRCLGENEKQCPKCAPDHRLILDIKKSNENHAAHHEQFFRQLDGSEDGFAVIADYLGRNLLSRAKELS